MQTFVMPTLPRYRCHKEVSAIKIKAIERNQPPMFLGPTCKGCYALGTACGQCERCKWEREHGSQQAIFLVPEDPAVCKIQVTPDFFVKHNPQVDGYFVVYEDGYQSYSPAKAFEEGYTRI